MRLGCEGVGDGCGGCGGCEGVSLGGKTVVVRVVETTELEREEEKNREMFDYNVLLLFIVNYYFPIFPFFYYLK